MNARASHGRNVFVFMVALAVVAGAAVFSTAEDSTAAGPGVVYRIADGGDYTAIAISADSLYVAFERQVIERKTGRVVAVAPGTSVYNPLDLSADGNVFAFATYDSLVPEDVYVCGPTIFDLCQDVYVFDATTGQYEMISVDSSGTPGNVHSGQFDDIAISGDGRYVAFVSQAVNLVPDLDGGGVFVRDRTLGTTTRIARPGGGALAVNMSADGRYLTYDSTDGGVYWHDRDSDGNGIYDEPLGTNTLRVSDGSYPVISDDASALAFYLDDRIVYYDVVNDVKVSVAGGGFFGGTGMDLSKDGRYLAFATTDGLRSEDDNNMLDVYLYDHRSPIMAPFPWFDLLSQQQGGPVGDGPSAFGFPLEHLSTIALTPDARFAAFYTDAPNLGGPAVVLAATHILGLLDTDQDGCSDKAEVGPRPQLGGGRNPNNFWDFFDTPPRDKVISVKDIGNVVRRFGSMGDAGIDPLSDPPASPEYHTAFDRTPAPNQLTGPPNGSISITDIMLSVLQFGHSCMPVSTFPPTGP